jgi:hypothetical protein
MAFSNAIITSKTTMNTQIKGQHGYRKDSIMQQKTEAQRTYEEFGWIIK